MPIDLSALKTELTTDPMSYGYAPYVAAGDMRSLAALVNLIRAEIDIPRPDVTPLEILEAVNVSDFIANASVLYASWFESLTQFSTVRILKSDGSDTRVMNNLMKLLVNGSSSETRLRALSIRDGSRAEVLFGPGESVTDTDCANALYHT